MQVIKLDKVISMSGLSKSTIYTQVKEGKFPAPIKLGVRSSGWIEEEVLDWVKGKMEPITNHDLRKPMKANCKNCGAEFSYRDSQSGGTFCSNTCQGELTVKQKFVCGSKFSNAMRRYLLKSRGLQCESSTCHAPYGYVDTNPKAFQIDHVNGDREDNRHQNLKVLCAICHCKTPTWGQGNASGDGLKRMRQEEVA